MTRAPWIINGVQLPRKSKVESGLFRLSCPRLVKAVDEWEAEGAVASLNNEIRRSGRHATTHDGLGAVAGEQEGLPHDSLAAKLERAHEEHSAARKELVRDRLPAVLAEMSEEEHTLATRILDSGIAGQTRSKIDLKCVHAQLADHLCRSQSNGLAAELMQRLEDRGVPVRGDDACRSQCNLALPEDAARANWWYEPSKNKWKLKKNKQRRKERRARNPKAAKATAVAGVEGDEGLLRDLDRASG